MAVEIRAFQVTIPAGTAISAGFQVPLSIPVRVVTQIDIRVPPGPRGEVGFGIGSAGNTIIPYGGLSYIITDDQSLSFPLEESITSGAWVLYGYNTGVFDHTLYVYFLLDLVGEGVPSTGPTPLPPGPIEGGGGGGGTGGGGVPVPVPVPTPPPVPVPVPVPVPPPPPGGGGLILPPAPPALPGAVSPRWRGGPTRALVAPAGTTQVWLLDTGGYDQLGSQEDVNALVAAGVPGLSVSSAQHEAFQRGAPARYKPVRALPPRTI